MTRKIAEFLKNVVNCKDVIIDSFEIINPIGEEYEEEIIIGLHPKAYSNYLCPVCGRKSPKDGIGTEERLWRHVDVNGMPCFLKCDSHRVKCKEHGSHVASVPWAYPGSTFTKDLDRLAASFARELPKTFVAEYLRIDWHTVGRCVTRTLNDLEPDILKRLEGLKRMAVDETSYKKGHQYITTVINIDNHEVVWVHMNHGRSVFEKFCKLLTPKQLAEIEIVAGDGAKWIDECLNQYMPNATRCVDPFHVVQWGMEALDAVRTDIWREVRTEKNKLNKEKNKIIANAKEREEKESTQGKEDESEVTEGKGNDPAPALPVKNKKMPDFTPEEQEQMNKLEERIKEAEAKASEIKGAKYAVGKAPENLTKNQELKLEMVAQSHPVLYKAYCLKERLRILLKMDLNEGREELATWISDAASSGIPAFENLGKKVLRHSQNIENFLATGVSSAAIEAMNNKIKLAFRKAYGFRNIHNMINMVYFVCSRIVIPRPHGGKIPRAYSYKGLFHYTGALMGSEDLDDLAELA